jgi:uncharacterized membrane protein
MRQLNHIPKRTGGQGIAAHLASAAILAAGSAGAAFGQCNYSHQEIVAPPCPFIGPPPLIGTGLSNHGEVVGHFRDCDDTTIRHPFYWSEKTGLVLLPKPEGATTMRPTDINDHRQISGEVLFPDLPGPGWRGFMYDMNAQTFHLLEPAVESGQAYANAINNNGIVAGSRSTKATGPSNYNAVIWRPLEKGAPVEDLGVIGGPNSSAQGINEVGEIAGWYGSDWFTTNARAFFWNTNEIIELGVLEGSVQSAAFSVNTDSEIVGISRAPNPDGGGLPLQSFYWNGQMTQIGWPPGYSTNAVHAISNLGQIVGNAGTPGSSTVGYLTQLPHLVVTKLDELTDGISLSAGRAVNDQGQILAISATKAVLLTPIDVPFADLNFDCKVDFYDLQILLEQWGPVPRRAGNSRNATTPSADFNSDGVVDGRDLLILLSNWNP